MRRKIHNAAGGFTIIESLVVLLIIILLASITIPGLKMWSEKKSAVPGRMPGPKAAPAGGEVMPHREQADAGSSLAEPFANE